MRKIRLNEKQLHRIIKESVNNILNDSYSGVKEMDGNYRIFANGRIVYRSVPGYCVDSAIERLQNMGFSMDSIQVRQV